MRKLHPKLLPALCLIIVFPLGDYSAQVRKRVKINLEQIRILTQSANEISERIESTENELDNLENERQFERTKDVLMLRLFESMKEVRETENLFQQAARNNEQREAGREFFGDLITRYESSNERLGILKFDQGGYMSARKNVIGLLNHNRLAYTIVAAAQQATIDFFVTSVPDKAEIYLRRYDEKNYRRNVKNTDAPITRTYAVWYIKVHLDGYEDEEKEFNPFEEKNRTIQFVLKQK